MCVQKQNYKLQPSCLYMPELKVQMVNKGTAMTIGCITGNKEQDSWQGWRGTTVHNYSSFTYSRKCNSTKGKQQQQKCLV